MSTFAKGDAFEGETFLLLKKEVEVGRLGILPSSGRILKEKDIVQKIAKKIS